LLALALAVASGCSKRRPTEPQEEEAVYIGSGWCGYCHESILTSFLTTGHPHELVIMQDGILPTYPDVSPGLEGAGTPPYFYWTDVTYVIGGYGWKAMFTGPDGYIITSGGENQFNLADSTWTDYHKDEILAYDCGPCHTTGYSATGNQEDFEGIEGTWAFPGIQCERCHGPGSKHAEDPYESGMTIDASSYFCGECHSRGDPNTIPASDGFIDNHEQYNELLASPKASMDCTVCHDPHKRAHWNPDGILSSCKSCHSDQRIEIPQMAAFECEDCHMPYATKSAKSPATYQGDVRTHLFRINTDSLAQMFDSTGAYANGYLTIEYSCMYGSCHQDDTKGYLSSTAGYVH
jgi:hypothetical protein